MNKRHLGYTPAIYLFVHILGSLQLSQKSVWVAQVNNKYVWREWHLSTNSYSQGDSISSQPLLVMVELCC